VRDFDSLNKCIRASRATSWSPEARKVGAVRKLTIKDGPTFTERLVAFDAAHHSYRYKIVESPLPFTGYVSTISCDQGLRPDKGDLERELPSAGTLPTIRPRPRSERGRYQLPQGRLSRRLDNLKKIAEKLSQARCA